MEIKTAIDAGWDINETDPRFGETALINSIRVKRLDTTRLETAVFLLLFFWLLGYGVSKPQNCLLKPGPILKFGDGELV